MNPAPDSSAVSSSTLWRPGTGVLNHFGAPAEIPPALRCLRLEFPAQPLIRAVPAARSALIARKIVVSCAGWGWA